MLRDRADSSIAVRERYALGQTQSRSILVRHFTGEYPFSISNDASLTIAQAREGVGPKSYWRPNPFVDD